MRILSKAIFLSALVALAGCGGGGGGYGGGGSMPGGNNSGSGASSTLATATLLGSSGYVASNGHTVYVLSSDSWNNSTCTAASGCTGLWPIIAPPGGSMSTGFSTFMRSDGLTQLEYNGWPLYMYSGDSASGQTNGNGINSFGGVWSIARPGMASSSGAPAGY